MIWLILLPLIAAVLFFTWVTCCTKQKRKTTESAVDCRLLSKTTCTRHSKAIS